MDQRAGAGTCPPTGPPFCEPAKRHVGMSRSVVFPTALQASLRNPGQRRQCWQRLPAAAPLTWLSVSAVPERGPLLSPGVRGHWSPSGSHCLHLWDLSPVSCPSPSPTLHTEVWHQSSQASDHRWKGGGIEHTSHKKRGLFCSEWGRMSEMKGPRTPKGPTRKTRMSSLQ